MENNEYFTPSIEDIRINYEYEFHGMTVGGLYLTNEDGTKDEELSREPNIPVWSKEKAGLGFWNRNPGSIPELLENGQIRVPFLTKEQIESEGWKEGELGGFQKEIDKDSYYSLRLNEDNQIIITKCFIEGWAWVWKPFYSGECKDINTFRWICKLLGI